ncbi:MAG: hypothetical protein ACI8RZ_000613 [Myxococcota bacterium]|jgi:hypothetical protein
MLFILSGLLSCKGPGQASPDSGDTAVILLDQPGLIQDRVMACAEPELRQTLGPMFLADLGEDWANQIGDDSGMGMAVEDFDGDGRLDIFLPDHDGCTLYIAQPDGTYADESALRLPKVCAGISATPADLEGDGDIDLFLAGVATPEMLLVNDGGGTFVDEAEPRGLTLFSPDPSMGAAWGDLEGDGDLDLLVSNHTFREGEGPSPPQPAYTNRLLINDGDTFSDLSTTLSERVLRGYTFIAGWHDFNVDGSPDVYIVNDFGEQVYENSLLLNDGLGGLIEADESTGLNLAINGMGLGVGDLNGDGLPDLAVSDWGSVHLMLSLEPGIWYDSALASGLVAAHTDSVVGWGVEMADFDNDADLDLMAVFGPSHVKPRIDLENPEDQPDALWLNDGGSFTDVGAEWGVDETANNRGLVIADLNGDGWLDTIRRSPLEGKAVVHLSRCGEDAWVTVRLVAEGGNPDGIGARIVATEDGVSQTRWITSGSTGLASGGPLMAHFGLGDAGVLDALAIHWPDGNTSEFTNISTRQALTVRQADSE